MHSMAEGFAVRRIPIRESKANSYNLPRCPLWGWCSAQRIKIAMIAGGNHTSVSCREAAKGVSLVTLSCYHSTNDTPSVSLCSTAPPLGSRGPRYPLWGWCVAQPSLPPLGEVPQSGKGGAVGNFELLPFNEQHPLSLALLDSSPIGEPRASLPPLGVVRRTALAAPSGGGALRSELR